MAVETAWVARIMALIKLFEFNGVNLDLSLDIKSGGSCQRHAVFKLAVVFAVKSLENYKNSIIIIY